MINPILNLYVLIEWYRRINRFLPTMKKLKKDEDMLVKSGLIKRR